MKCRKLLKAMFRVYNKSIPKNKLSGRTVVVFKNKADPPIKWLAVPNVLLSDGQPNGNIGQAFNINNFITMRHHAYGLKVPITYDAAAVYVFSTDGELLASKEADFKIEYQPIQPPKAEPVVPSKDKATSPVESKTPVGEATSAPQETPDASGNNTADEVNATEETVKDSVDQDTTPPSTDMAQPERSGEEKNAENETVTKELTPDSKKPTP